MKIIDKIDSLKAEYANDTVTRKNGTLLLGPGGIPRCRHMLFAPLEERYIDEFLLGDFTDRLPVQYTEFLRSYNGANLCGVKLTTKKGKKEFSFAQSLLTVYGLPMTQPFGRPDDEEEPYDVRVENLARHKAIPTTWLKIGAYGTPPDFARIDIFVDAETGRTYACPKNEANVLGEWNDLDSCLCELFDTFSAAPTEYDWKC